MEQTTNGSSTTVSTSSGGTTSNWINYYPGNWYPIYSYPYYSTYDSELVGWVKGFLEGRDKLNKSELKFLKEKLGVK